MKKLEQDFKEKKIEQGPLTWPETIEFLKQHKLEQFAEDLANKRIEEEYRGNKIFCCASLDLLKWIRAKSVESKVQMIKNTSKKDIKNEEKAHESQDSNKDQQNQDSKKEDAKESEAKDQNEVQKVDDETEQKESNEQSS